MSEETDVSTTTAEETMLDEEWLSAPRKRSRLRIGIVVALAGSVCFLGGALVQKQFGEDETAAASSSGFPEGFPGGSGGLPSGSFPGLGAASGDDQGTAPSGQGEGSAADSEDSVIGTVVKKDGDTWVVEDLGGKRHEITVGDDARIIRESQITGDDVAKGDRVQVTGTTSGDQLRASDITLR